jgi:DNA-binding MarR family transcriptional regulator
VDRTRDSVLTTPLTRQDLAAGLQFVLMRLTRVMRQAGSGEALTLAELSALGTLHALAPITAGELAKRERLRPPSMTKVLASLADRGLISRDVDPHDRRRTIVTVTAEGARRADDERRSRDAWLTGKLAALTRDERILLRRALPILTKLGDGERAS